MPSKQVVDSQKSALSVIAVAESHAGAVAEKLQRWLRQEERTTEDAEHTEGDFLMLRQQIFLCVP